MRESEAMFLFVTGTDTGCGKTTFACALLRRFGEMGVRGAPCKPMETGCESGADGALIPADGRRLVACSPTPIDEAIAAPHRFGDPVSPAIAMEKHGAELSLEDLEKAVREASRHCDVLVVEGAGGERHRRGDDRWRSDREAARSFERRSAFRSGERVDAPDRRAPP